MGIWIFCRFGLKFLRYSCPKISVLGVKYGKTYHLGKNNLLGNYMTRKHVFWCIERQAEILKVSCSLIRETKKARKVATSPVPPPKWPHPIYLGRPPIFRYFVCHCLALQCLVCYYAVAIGQHAGAGIQQLRSVKCALLLRHTKNTLILCSLFIEYKW